jgi:hypothetical protein
MIYFISWHLGDITLGWTGNRKLQALLQMISLFRLRDLLLTKVASHINTQAVLGYMLHLIATLISTSAASCALDKRELALVQVNRQIAQRVLPLAAIKIKATEYGQVDELSLQIVVRHDLVLGHIATARWTRRARAQHVIEALGAHAMLALKKHRALQVLVAEAAFVLLLQLAHLELDIRRCPMFQNKKFYYL